MDRNTTNPTYPTVPPKVFNVIPDIKQHLVSEWRTPRAEALMNEGARVPFTKRIAMNQAMDFEEGDLVTSFTGYFPFHTVGMLYFHAPSRDPNFYPPTDGSMRTIAQNSMYPMVVQRDGNGVFCEIPHMVVARFAVSGNGFVIDDNDAPVIELFTMCCDTNEARFDTKTHLKLIDGTLTLLAGVMIEDWSQVTWNDDFLPRPTMSVLQRRWNRALVHCYDEVDKVTDQNDCVAKSEAN